MPERVMSGADKERAMQPEVNARPVGRSPRTNQLLTVAVVLLAVLVVRPAEFGSASADAAQQTTEREPTPTLPNAGAQRERMITALRSLEQRLDRIERTLNAGLEVRVTEMPQVRIAE
jgi:hypothetical protein